MSAVFPVCEFLLLWSLAGLAGVLCACLFHDERRGPGGGLGMAVLSLFAALLVFGIRKWPGFSGWYRLVLLFFVVGGTRVLYPDAWKKAVAVLLLLFSGGIILEAVLLIGVRFFNPGRYYGYYLMTQDSWERLACLGFARAAEGAGVWILCRKRAAVRAELKRRGRLVFLFGGAFYYFSFRLEMLAGQVFYWKMLWERMGDLLVLSLFLFVFYEEEKRGEKLRKEREEAARQKDLLYLGYERLKYENQRIYIQVHEDNKHYRMLAEFLRQGQLEKLDRYLQELTSVPADRKPVFWTGDETLDLILNWKIGEAEKQGVEVSVEAELFRCSVEEKDLCSLIGNLFDNALEAEARKPVSEKKIEVHLSRLGKFFLFQIANPVAERPRQENGKWLSAKRGYSRPGYGMEIVKEIAEKYQGEMTAEYEESVFKVTIMLLENR